MLAISGEMWYKDNTATLSQPQAAGSACAHRSGVSALEGGNAVAFLLAIISRGCILTST